MSALVEFAMFPTESKSEFVAKVLDANLTINSRTVRF